MMEKGKVLNETVIAYENAFLESHKGTFVGDVINLKMEKKQRIFLKLQTEDQIVCTFIITIKITIGMVLIFKMMVLCVPHFSGGVFLLANVIAAAYLYLDSMESKGPRTVWAQRLPSL